MTKKLNRTISAVALPSLLVATPLHATPDDPFLHHETATRQPHVGVGAIVGIRINLGSERVVERSERVKLGVAAGPVMMTAGAWGSGAFKRSEPSLIGLELKPGYSTSLNFSGKPVSVSYTKLGAVEAGSDGDHDGGGIGDDIAWVAAIAGAVVVGAVVVYSVSCGPGEDSNCGSR